MFFNISKRVWGRGTRKSVSFFSIEKSFNVTESRFCKIQRKNMSFVSFSSSGRTVIPEVKFCAVYNTRQAELDKVMNLSWGEKYRMNASSQEKITSVIRSVRSAKNVVLISTTMTENEDKTIERARGYRIWLAINHILLSLHWDKRWDQKSSGDVQQSIN